jgi:transketolase
MVGAASSGHPGGSLSAADIVTVLYFNEMNIRPDDPKWPDRDRFVLSKGHAAPVLYAALAEAGYFPAEELVTLRRIDSHLQGHPSIRSTPGVEMSTGSLGQGLSAACGMAIAAKLDGAAWRVYALLGDGELEEGQIWEAVMTAAHRRLDNLTAFVDANGLQIDGPVADIKSMERIGDRFAAFGWHVVEIDGHDIPAIMAALAEARNTQGRPTAIVARTVKGKGVSFMENQVGWHGTAPKPDQVQAALAELDASGEGGDIQ